ncbi:MAG: pyridoxal 5'-phosphate synthase glutaminase subunit PdxT [Actinobacteria bacterium]|nr:MAG: pyridoxal 5'-phosphate synthase glutaminase subunit PdxT [Actinomycetota bacterium]
MVTSGAAGQTTVGVLALQGDVRSHLRRVADLGARGVPVKRPDQLAGLDALIVPGGESTTISMLAQRWGLIEPVRELIRGGFPVFGSCAGMIMLADTVLDGRADQLPFGGIDMVVRRNAFGRQVDSFEADVEVAGIGGGPMRAIFIRAPWVESIGDGVEVLAAVDDRFVAVRQGALLATSFHPELTGDLRLHEYFLQLAR